eukprot:gene14073-13867_t
MQIEYIWIILATLLVLAELWAINCVLRTLWVVVIVFVPLLGMILWAITGPKAIAKENAGANR